AVIHRRLHFFMPLRRRFRPRKGGHTSPPCADRSQAACRLRRRLVRPPNAWRSYAAKRDQAAGGRYAYLALWHAPFPLASARQSFVLQLSPATTLPRAVCCEPFQGGGSGLDYLLRLTRARQIQLDRGAVSLLAVDIDVSTRLLDETVDHPEAGALADPLGGKERIEDLVADARGNAAAGIAHRDHHIVAGTNLGVGTAVRFIAPRSWSPA